jgi:hypothetical protein
VRDIQLKIRPWLAGKKRDKQTLVDFAAAGFLYYGGALHVESS